MRHNWVALGIGLLMLASCADNSGTTGLMVGNGDSARQTQGFSLRLLEDGSGAACQPGEAWLEPQTATDGTLTMEVHISGAKGLNALYCAVDYDAGNYSPVSAAASGLLGERGEILELAVLSEPGMAYLGQVQASAGGVAAPFAGDGTAARFVFREGKFTSEKRVSRAPEGEWNEFSMLYDQGTSQNYWLFTSAGDYNQDGEVGIQDLTPLASRFGNSTEIPNWKTGYTGGDYRSLVVDGDHNGEINQGDISVIAMNFGVKFDHYCVFTSDDPTAYPLDSNGSAAVSLAGEYSIADAVTTTSIVTKHFRLDQSVGLEDYAWIIPYDAEGNAGQVSLLRPSGNWNGQLCEPDHASPTWWDGETNTVSWFMVLPGDYDQNGETGTADQVPLFLQYDERGPFEVDSASYVADGNQDGVINSLDAEVIKQYFVFRITDYAVYTSNDISDYPALPVSSSKIGPIAYLITYGSSSQDLFTEHGRRYFTYSFTEEDLKRYVWIRPVSSGREGTPGELIDTQADTN